MAKTSAKSRLVIFIVFVEDRHSEPAFWTGSHRGKPWLGSHGAAAGNQRAPPLSDSGTASRARLLLCCGSFEFLPGGRSTGNDFINQGFFFSFLFLKIIFLEEDRRSQSGYL